MRSTLLSACLCLIVAFSCTPVTAASLEYHHRRDASPSSTDVAASTASPSPASSSNDARASSASRTDSANSEASTSASPSSSAPAASSTLVTITSSSSAPTSSAAVTTNTTNAAPNTNDTLPLPPAITPALSIAGAFLMISGLVYAVVGIKNKWLQIYISTAYLVSLAITVLIVYVVNPPISLAIQGAYFVGAFIPALGIGGLALIFKDVTEGLGCAVGGFCLSMFFLVLKPGGLLSGTASKAIFIGCWTVGIYALSFSHYVRSYALIGATSLGGATAVILGIDCFSLAGLKEFWIYIWGLNDKLFPLLNDTYPITRGIRVEIAGMVIFTFVGVLSQMRIWKVVRDRRQRHETERLEANRERDELEAELGRRLEDGNARDREQWEGVYGQGTHDSGIGTEASSTRKASTSIETKGVYGATVETVEMNMLPTSQDPLEQDSKLDTENREERKSVQVGVNEVVPTPTWNPESSWTSKELAGRLKDQEASSGSNQSPIVTAEVDNQSSEAVYSGPNIVPLPFELPANTGEDDVASLATCASSKRESRRLSHRFSGSFLARKFSQRSKRFSMQSSTSVEALTDGVPRDINSLDSQGGSQTSDFADREEETKQPRPGSTTLHDTRFSFEAPVRDEKQLSGYGGSTNTAGNNQQHSTRLPSEALTKTNNVASVREIGSNEDSTSNRLPEMSAGTDTTAPEPTAEPSAQNVLSGDDKVPKNKEPIIDDSPAPAKKLSEVLPIENASKIVLQYRTNEWAKHLEKAEEPEFDSIDTFGPLVEEPSTIPNAEELLQTPLTAEPSPAVPSAETKRSMSASTTSPTMPTDVRSPTRVPSFTIEDTSLSSQARPTLSSVPRGSSRNSARKSSRVSSFHHDPHRSSSRPHLTTKRSSSTPLANSTIDEDAEFSFSPAPSPLPSNTLLAQRSTMLRNKSLTGSSRPISSSIYPSTPSDGSASPGLSQNTSYVSLASQDDNIPLSARRSFLQRTSSTQSFQSTTPPPHPAPSPSPSSPHRPPPSPIRSPSATDPSLRRASMLAAWRSSLDQDFAASKAPEQEVQARREEMWQERARERSRRGREKERERERTRKEGRRVRDSSGMGAKEMNEAHREVLRRMQAGANKALKGT